MKENHSVFCSILGTDLFHCRHLDNALQMFLLRYFFFKFNISLLSSPQEVKYFQFPGELLMRMLKMLILPLVVSR